MLSALSAAAAPRPLGDGTAVVSWNCNGLSRKVGLVQAYLREHAPLALLLQETRLGAAIPDAQYSGYRVHSFPGWLVGWYLYCLRVGGARVHGKSKVKPSTCVTACTEHEPACSPR